MKETLIAMLATIFHNLILPNALFTVMMGTSAFYYQSVMEGGSPTWRAVAVGSMAIVGSLAGLGYRDFVRRMRILEAELEADRKHRDLQHLSNVAAIVAMALAGQDKDKIERVIDQLLKGKPHA